MLLSSHVDLINEKNKQTITLNLMACTKLRLWYHVKLLIYYKDLIC